MKMNWICGILFAVALTAAAPAQIGVYIGRTPPPERYEERGAMPGPGYAWVDGYWAPNGHRYRGAGTGHPMREHIGTILTTITTSKAGSCMKATGIMKTTSGIADTMAIITITDQTITDLMITDLTIPNQGAA